jgi:hypothetical protein
MTALNPWLSRKHNGFKISFYSDAKLKEILYFCNAARAFWHVDEKKAIREKTA